jgi:hypothetical protein
LSQFPIHEDHYIDRNETFTRYRYWSQFPIHEDHYIDKSETFTRYIGHNFLYMKFTIQTGVRRSQDTDIGHNFLYMKITT